MIGGYYKKYFDQNYEKSKQHCKELWKKLAIDSKFMEKLENAKFESYKECKNQLSRIREQFIEEIRGPAGTDFILQKMEECEVLQRSLMKKLRIQERLKRKKEAELRKKMEEERLARQRLEEQQRRKRLEQQRIEEERRRYQQQLEELQRRQRQIEEEERRRELSRRYPLSSGIYAYPYLGDYYPSPFIGPRIVILPRRFSPWNPYGGFFL